MANRNFQNNNYHLERSKVELFMDVTIGATGAPTVNYSMGFDKTAPITRTAAGEYDLKLADKYSRLLGFNVTVINGTIAEHLNDRYNIEAETVSTTKIIKMFCVADTSAGDLTPVAKEVSDGARLLIKVELKNSRLNK